MKMEAWEEKELETELKTSAEERLRWLAQAARFLWEAATPEVRELYELACRDELETGKESPGHGTKQVKREKQ